MYVPRPSAPPATHKPGEPRITDTIRSASVLTAEPLATEHGSVGDTETIPASTTPRLVFSYVLATLASLCLDHSNCPVLPSLRHLSHIAFVFRLFPSSAL